MIHLKILYPCTNMTNTKIFCVLKCCIGCNNYAFIKKNQIKDDLKKIIEDDLKKIIKTSKTTSKKIFKKIEPILTNSTVQYRKPDQHNNQKYIGRIKGISLIWL